MKLRIRGDSLRLRLTRSEVEALHSSGLVEGRTGFGLREFVHALVRDELVNEVEARFDGDRISVHVPVDRIDAWASSEDVSIAHEQKIDGSRTLVILVEKDFQCLIPRGEEEDDDAYPNPNADQS